MHRRNSLHRVRMRKKRRVLRGISLGAKFIVVLIGLVIIFKNQINKLLETIFKQINSQSKEVYS